MRLTPLILTALIAATLGESSAADSQYAGHGIKSVSKETLARFRPEPLDPELARRVQAMLDIRSTGGGILTPDGKSLFFSWRVTGTTQVWRVDGPDRFPVQVTGGEDSTSLSDITPDGKYLVLERDQKGAENPGIYLQSVEGGALIPVQHKEGVQTIFQFVSDDSRYLYYRANDEVADSYTLYRYDISARKTEKLIALKGVWQITDHLADGTLLLEKAKGGIPTEYHEWKPGMATPRPLFGQRDNEEFNARYFNSTGEVLVRTSKFGEFHRLYRWKDGQYTAITPELKWDVSAFSLDARRERIYYSVNEGGYTRSFVLDARTLKPLPLPEFKDADNVIVGSLSQDGRYANLLVETAREPRSSYVFDWKTGSYTRWTRPSTPEVNTSQFATASLEYYPARDGTKIPMFVRRPAECKPAPCPVVVHFHGGPAAQSEAGFSIIAQLFVNAGFIYVDPNVRGSEGYGKTWLHADDGPKRLDVITDIEDAARFIRANWGAGDKQPRIGIMGGSYGGYATLMGMTLFSGAYDAGASAVGISNLLTYMENTAPYRRMLRIDEYGDPAKDREAMIKLSPTTHIDKLAAPLLIVQGANDPRVPVGEAVQMYEAAQRKSVPAKLMIFADEGHGTARRENQVLQYGHMLQFFEKHLKTK